MSILIKGMEMPKACMECPIETDYGTCGYYSLYVEAGHESDCEKRRDDCPLIELPTPHGRLIDADALKWNYIRIRDDGIKEFSQYGIDRAPTIIPAEEDET